MRALLQRVTRARVRSGDEEVGACGAGLLVLLCVLRGDSARESDRLAARVARLRMFDDDAGKLNLSVLESGGEVLAVSQFTLAGDCTRGRRPSFEAAARPEIALPLFERFVAALEAEGLRCATGRFGAPMAIELEADGPVTLLLEEAPPRGAADPSA